MFLFLSSIQKKHIFMHPCYQAARESVIFVSETPTNSPEIPRNPGKFREIPGNPGKSREGGNFAG